MIHDVRAMASLVVSADGELRCEPEWLEAEDDGVRLPDGWAPVTVDEGVAVGILRLMRERDEAREAARVFCLAKRGEPVAMSKVRQTEDRFKWLWEGVE